MVLGQRGWINRSEQGANLMSPPLVSDDLRKQQDACRMTRWRCYDQENQDLGDSGLVGLFGDPRGDDKMASATSASCSSTLSCGAELTPNDTFVLVSSCMRLSYARTSSRVIEIHSSIQAKACRWPKTNVCLITWKFQRSLIFILDILLETCLVRTPRDSYRLVVRASL